MDGEELGALPFEQMETAAAASRGRGRRGPLVMAVAAAACLIGLITMMVIAGRVGGIWAALAPPDPAAGDGGTGAATGASVLAGLHAQPGFITVHSGVNTEAKGGPQEIVYFQIPESVLGTLFLQTNLVEQGDGHGNVAHTQAGDSGAPLYYQLSTDGARVELYEKQYAVRASQPQDQAVFNSSLSDLWLWSAPVAEKLEDHNGESSVVVDVTALIVADRFLIRDLGDILDKAPLARLVACKVYPRNMNLILELSNPGKHVDIRLFISLARLPAAVMVARQADRRVGYFSTPYVDIGVHAGVQAAHSDAAELELGQVDRRLRFVHKWRLEAAADCTEALCDPVTPVRFHVDPSVPPQWREYIKIGIELWQPAFEAIGFKNTPRAVLPTDADWPSDYDPGDIRYSSISFSVSRDSVYSVGPSIVDPRSGQILDADISFAQEWVAAFAGKVTYESPRDDGYSKGAKAMCLDPQGPRACQSAGKGPQARSDQRVRGAFGCHRERLEQAKDITAPLLRALYTTGDGEVKVPVEVIGRGLAGVTVHEVGHTLGLRHNFKASSTVPLPDLFTTATLTSSSSSSVMDYIGGIFAPNATMQASTTIFPDGHTIGAYDHFAIQYGYTPVAGEAADQQHPEVEALAARFSAQHLVFGTDGDAGLEQDPLARRYDLSADPVGYAYVRLQVAVNTRRAAWQQLGSLPQEGFGPVAACFRASLRVAHTAASNAAYHLGGRVVSHGFPSEAEDAPAAPIRPVTSAYQGYALGVVRAFLQDPFWHDLAASRAAVQVHYQDSDTSPYGFYSLGTYSMESLFDVYAADLLKSLADPDKLLRVYRAAQLLQVGGEGAGWAPGGWTQDVDGGTIVGGQMTVYALLAEMHDIVWGQRKGWTSPAFRPLQLAWAKHIAFLANTSYWIERPRLAPIIGDVIRARDELGAVCKAAATSSDPATDAFMRGILHMLEDSGFVSA